MRLGSRKAALLFKIVQIVYGWLDDESRQIWTRGHHELISEVKNAVWAPSRLWEAHLGEYFARLDRCLVRLCINLTPDKQVSIEDGWPVDCEAVMAILLGLDLLIHKLACRFEWVKLVPSIYKPARYFPAIIAVCFENLREGAGFLRVVRLHLIVRVKLGASFDWIICRLIRIVAIVLFSFRLLDARLLLGVQTDHIIIFTVCMSGWHYVFFLPRCF